MVGRAIGEVRVSPLIPQGSNQTKALKEKSQAVTYPEKAPEKSSDSETSPETSERTTFKDKLDLFLQEVSDSLLEVITRGSRVAAFSSLGMAIAIGLLGGTAPYNIFTPLALALGGASGLIFSDMVTEKLARGKTGKAISEKLEKFARKLSDAFVKLFKTFPKFIYPSVHHATDEQIKLVYDTLDKLPIHYVTTTNTINFDPNLAPKMGAAGLTQQLLIDRPITLDPSQMALSKDWAEYVITHELGHSSDFLSAQHLNGFLSSMKPFGKPPYVTDYAGTNRFEDLAESYAHYHLMPDKLKAIAPEKYEALAKVEALKSVDPLNVIASQEPVRKAGRAIGELLSKLPYPVRFFMVGLSTSLPLLAISFSTKDLREATKEGDAKGTLKAKVRLAPALASLVSPPSVTLATLGEGIVLKKLVDKGKISPKTANKLIEGTIALLLGPLGGALIGTYRGLRSPDDKPSSNNEASNNEVTSSPGKGKIKEKDSKVKLTKKDWALLLLATGGILASGLIGGALLGGAIASALGSTLTEASGLTAGAAAEIIGGRFISTGIGYGISNALAKVLRKLTKA